MSINIVIGTSNTQPVPSVSLNLRFNSNNRRENKKINWGDPKNRLKYNQIKKIKNIITQSGARPLNHPNLKFTSKINRSAKIPKIQYLKR